MRARALDQANVELVAKLLDGTPVNGKYWCFYGALSDVDYTITVTDTLNPTQIRRYVNPQGNFCGGADVNAFSAATDQAATRSRPQPGG